MFALDITNYSRYLPIHIKDMAELETKHPEIYREFMNGNFVAQKTNNKFSSMALDQAHEQLNEELKSEGRIIGLTSHPSALQRWTVAGPEIVRIIQEFEDDVQEKKLSIGDGKHHEQQTSIQRRFMSDVNSLLSTLKEMGNPFL